MKSVRRFVAQGFTPICLLFLAGLVSTPGCGGTREFKTQESGGEGGAQPGVSLTNALGGGTGVATGELFGGEPTPEDVPGDSVAPPKVTPTETNCVPGTRACSCRENHACDEGMSCLLNVCGAVTRWGPWEETASWPEVQVMVWGGAQGMGGASAVGSVWE